MKRVIVLSGNDWNDAGYKLLNIPDDMNLKEQEAAYERWYRKEYCTDRATIPFVSFEHWLELKGANEMNDVEEYWRN